MVQNFLSISMAENIDWLFGDPLPYVDMGSCEPSCVPLVKTEVKGEEGGEEQVSDWTGVKAESSEGRSGSEGGERRQCKCGAVPVFVLPW